MQGALVEMFSGKLHTQRLREALLKPLLIWGIITAGRWGFPLSNSAARLAAQAEAAASSIARVAFPSAKAPKLLQLLMKIF